MVNNTAPGNMPMVFQYNDAKPIRTLVIDGDPWFVAKDVGEVLEYDRTHDLTRQLDEDEKGAGIVRTLGGDQEMVIINESGMYSAIFRSTKPEAKTFRRWVTQEVLPSIRRTGSYGTAATPAAPVRRLPSGNKKLPMDMQAHAATLHTLSLEEAGAWIKLVAQMWNTGGPLATEVATRLVGAPMLHQLEHLLPQQNGHCTLQWVEDARERQRQLSGTYAANGRMGGRGNANKGRKDSMTPSKAQQLTLRMLLALRNVPLDGLDHTRN